MKALCLAFFGAAFRMYLFVAIFGVLLIKAGITAAVLRDKGWDDKLIYLSLSMLMWFHFDDSKVRLPATAPSCQP